MPRLHRFHASSPSGRRPSRTPGARARSLAALAGTLFACGGPAAGVAHAATAGDPAANRTLSSATLQACQASPESAGCLSDGLSDIDAARAAEGVPPMVLPSGFARLSGAQQLLVLADLERVDRGLVPVLGLAASLDGDATTAAAADRDPAPSAFLGDAWSANWAGGYPSTLEVDFAWMYDDGPGSDNLDCAAPGDPGCWGHRHDILMPFTAPVVMGAAVGAGAYGTSMAELFVGGDRATGAGQADAVLAPGWAALSGQQAAGSTGAGTAGPGSTGAGTARPPSGSASGSPSRRPSRIALRAPVRVRSGRLARLSGTLSAALRHRRLELQRRAGRGWRTIATILSSPARFAFRLRPRGRGVLRLRLLVPGAHGAVRALTLRVVG